MGVGVQARTQDRFHLTFDAPVTLLLVMAAVVATLLPGAAQLLRLDPIGPVALLNPRWYLGVVGHVFAHQGLAHLIGNASMLLLLAPGLEKRLGGRRFCVIVGALIVLTGLSASVVLMFTQRSLVGASGLVFALIFLHSLAGSRHKEIPLTTILLGLLWGSKELLGLFDASQVANSAHLNGAFWGILLGAFGVLREGRAERP